MCDCGSSGTGKYLGKIGGQVGDRVDSMFHGAIAKGQKRFKSWTGLGDYNVQFNSLINPGSSTASGNIHINTTGRGTTIRYREYLGDLAVHPTVVGGFNVTEYKIQPGNVTTFPWLAPIAVQFDQYIIQGCILEFKTTTTDATTNSAIGSVIAASFYDVDDPAPTSKSSMLNTAYSAEAKMSEDMLHGIECEPSELSRNVYYTRVLGGAQATNADLSDYDVCNTYFATQGGSLTAGTIIGSMYVHYEFTFLKEKPYAGIPSRDRLFSTWLTNPADGVVCGFQMLVGASLASGVDLGITFAAGAMTIPRKLAGATLIMRGNLRGAAQATVAYPTGTYTESDQVEAPMPLFVQNGHNFATSPVETMSRFTWVNVMKVDDTPGDDATFSIVTFPGFPTTTLAEALGANSFYFEIEVIPKNYAFSLTI